MHRIRMTAIYAAGHFLVDFACALCMFRFARGTDVWYAAVLVYNAFAFVGQFPLGILADRFGGGKWFAAGGCLLAAAAFLTGSRPLVMSVAAGLGNALYHIGGGRDTLAVSEGRAGLLGVFVSPGALGLFCGMLLGKSAVNALPVPIALAAAAVMIAGLCADIPAERLRFDLTGSGAVALLAVFLVVCLRSYTGFLFAYSWKTGMWAWIFVLCVVLGKTSGGWLCDRFGAVKSSVISLGLAAALFLVSENAVCGCIAVLLFNMTMPVTLRAAADLLHWAQGTSFGLLTAALFLGFLPSYLGLPCVSAGWMYAALALLSLAVMLPALKRSPP